MPISTPVLARTLLVACASLVAVPTLAQSFSCAELKTVLADAEQDFSAFKGRQLKKETADDFARANGLPAGTLDIRYERLVHEANKPLSGAVTACEVIDGYVEDDESTVRQSSFECRYDPDSSAAGITPALREQLQGCVGGEVDPDSDDASLVINVEQVESGEGTRGVWVELETDPDDGATLAMRKAVCVAKTPEGCEATE